MHLIFCIFYRLVYAFEIMFLGDFENVEPLQSLIQSFENLIQFGIDLGKFDHNYQLYGDRQVRHNVTRPGDRLFAILQKLPFSEHFNSTASPASEAVSRCTT